MIKRYLKHFILFLSLICIFIYSASASSLSSSEINRTMTESLNTLSNIQKQLEYITRNIYNDTSSTASENALKQLEIYSNQLTAIQQTLAAIARQNLDKTQQNVHRALAATTTYLNFISMSISELTRIEDHIDRYDILDSIFVTNALVDIILSNIDIP